jgi:hypothetical protein
LNDGKDGKRKKGKKIRVVKMKSNNLGNRKINYKWIFGVTFWGFVFSAFFQMAQSAALERVSLPVAFGVIILIVALNVAFDIVGMAVTAADETPFHSLASRRTAGAKEAVRLIRNSEKVSSFCNDVVGDIAGIVSGAAAVAIVASISGSAGTERNFYLTIALTGAVAALTIGGKAFGKAIAILYCNSILFACGRLIHFFSRKKAPSGATRRGQASKKQRGSRADV